MMISISHCCGHAADHVVYGSGELIVRQRESMTGTHCPDCFHAKVQRLTASSVQAAAAPRPPLPRRRQA
jgi:hypothetical protein